MIKSLHISAIKQRLNRGPVSDDFPFVNSYIGHEMDQVRSFLIKRKIDKYHPISEYNLQTLCVFLEDADINTCGSCIPNLGCTYRRSTKKLPRPLDARWNTTLRIEYLDGRSIDMIKPQANKYGQYSLSKVNDRPAWFIENGYLYIQNDDNLKVVKAKYILERPEEASQFTTCDAAGNQTTDPCYNPLTEDYPIDSELVLPMYDLTAERLLASMQLPKDFQNDAKEIDEN